MRMMKYHFILTNSAGIIHLGLCGVWGLFTGSLLFVSGRQTRTLTVFMWKNHMRQNVLIQGGVI